MSSLPYFKFFSNDWLAGTIATHDMATQGIFINLAARTWKNGGTVTANEDKLARLLHVDKQLLAACLLLLKQDKLICLSGDGSEYSIKFVCEQLDAAAEVSAKRAMAGSKGGKISKRKAKISKCLHSESELELESDSKPPKPPVKPKPAKAPKPDPTAQALVIANQLRKLVTTKKKVNINDRQMKQWAYSIDKLDKSKGISLERQHMVMAKYSEHYGEQYWPVIESANSWGEKFTKVEDAITREYGQASYGNHKSPSGDITVLQSTSSEFHNTSDNLDGFTGGAV